MAWGYTYEWLRKPVLVHTLLLTEMTQLRAAGLLCRDWRVPGTAKPAPTTLWGSQQALMSPGCPHGHRGKPFCAGLGFSWTQLGQAATQQIFVTEHVLNPGKTERSPPVKVRNHEGRRGCSEVLGRKKPKPAEARH